MQDAVIAVVLEIISAKVRNVHGSWLHVLQLQVTEDAVSGSLGSSLRAETSATVLMQCSVHNCGACAHSLAGHDIDGDLMPRTSSLVNAFTPIFEFPLVLEINFNTFHQIVLGHVSESVLGSLKSVNIFFTREILLRSEAKDYFPRSGLFAMTTFKCLSVKNKRSTFYISRASL